MFITLLAVAGLLQLADTALVQYGYMKNTKAEDPKRVYVPVHVLAVLEDTELQSWNDLSLDTKVLAFRRGLQRQEYKEHIENRVA
jgi:hypothetical protein